MGRSSKKAPYIHPSLLKKVLKAQEDGDKKVIKTWSRASVIYPEFVGLTIGVYNGKEFIPVVCDEQKVGFRLGEFSPTRRFRSHSGKLAK